MGHTLISAFFISMALLDLNGQPATNPELNDSRQSEYYAPNPDEKKDIDLLFKCLGEGKQFRSKYDKHWDKWERYYDGDQWEVKRSEGKSMPVVNVIRQAIQSMVPILTDAQPGFDINAKAPQDYDFADILSDIIHYWWTYRGMNLTLVDTITQSMFYHVGIQKVIWDEELENGLGDVRVDDIDPRDVWVPKDAIDFNKNCRWVIHRMCKPLGELRRLFPEKADVIKATGEEKSKSEKQTNSYDGQIMVVSPIDKKEKNIPQQPGYGYDDSRVVEFFEMWIMDTTLEQVEQENKDTHVPETVMKKRYPHGKIISVTSDRVLLQSAESPRKDGKFPFVRFVDMPRPNKFYGDGEIGQLYEPQKMLNKTVAVIFDCLNMLGNPVLICDTNSGVDADLLTNTVGQVIIKNPNTEVRRDQAPPIPEYIFQFYGEMQKMIDQISGLHDVTQGRKPIGITAAKAISTLQEAAQTRIRLKERNLQVSLTQLGYLVVNTMMQYYVQPRIAKVSQKQQQWPDFLEFYFKQPDADNYSVTKRAYTFDEANRKYIMQQDWTESIPTKGIFDIEVQSGTALPFQKDQRSNLALDLFDKKAIDQESLLDTLQWKDKDKIMTRMKQEAAQAAAAQAAGSPPPPGGQ